MQYLFVLFCYEYLQRKEENKQTEIETETENTRFVQDSMDNCKHNKIPGFLFLVNNEKALEKIELSFIHRTISSILDLILQNRSTFLYKCTTCICNNRYSTGFFSLQWGKV